MPAEFAGATAFLSTGNPAQEGFPNVLLQAAAAQTPVFSLEDFDGFITRSKAGQLGCGKCTDEGIAPDIYDKIAEELKAFVDSDAIAWDDVHDYLSEYHSHRRAAEMVAAILRQLVQDGAWGES